MKPTTVRDAKLEGNFLRIAVCPGYCDRIGLGRSKRSSLSSAARITLKCGAGGGARPTQHESLLFFFLHITARGFGFLHNLLLQHPRHRVVVMHFHVEAAAALGH